MTKILSDWTSVERDVKIPWDLEATPLQIKTNSTANSKEKILVWLKNVGAVTAYISPP